MPTTESSTPPPPSISQTTTPATPTMTNATGANNVESTSATTPLNMNSTPNDKTTHRDRVRLKGKFPSTMTPSGRQDVLALKQQLADALGENGPLYWDALKDFVAGKLNRQEFDFYANLYLSRENAYLHNAFILSTIHNAQAAHPPPSKHRSVGWAKRKRGKDGSLLDGSQDRDPQKRRLKMDVMSLSKADRDRLKQLVKSGDKERLRPFVDQVLGPRISRVPPLPLPAEQLPQTFNSDYARGLLAPLCADLKELPGPETLRARMTSIALEQGLVGGVSEDVVSAMLFATESYIKSAIANAISKRRVNRTIGVRMRKDTDETRTMALEQMSLTASSTTAPSSSIQKPSSSSSSSEQEPTKDVQMSEASNNATTKNEDEKSSITSSSVDTPGDSISLRDLAFSFSVSPYVLVENPLSAERLTALLTDSEDEETDDDLGDSSSEGGFEL
ncbi:predicted protein [Lichtheimia corymbifera JMRC:FSU:9682]|uniref:Transcriptional regulator of RNA polII, SAGA, subunit-domain-containing protein n=1 Tax=Lichtheimia corymbifera JMRC:FSU:9682 TaxID=1263082 RepID=A0A068RR46_9FUNG|nr:predicted protein [Lichtheimia corymbifera JMRC:FSU:9682]